VLVDRVLVAAGVGQPFLKRLHCVCTRPCQIEARGSAGRQTRKEE
jgi:hypothetical protein